MKAIIILLLSVSMYAQVSSGGAKRVSERDPKAHEWLVSPGMNSSGLPDSEATVSNHRESDPLERKYLALESAMVASAAFDTGTTIHNLRNGCSENNPLMGSHPSTARVVAFEAGWTAGELVVAHFLRHRHPKIAAVLLGESLIEHGVAGGLNTTQKCF